jgi:hypothetical protein
VLSVFVQCGSKYFITSGGFRIAVAASQVAGVQLSKLTAAACAAIPLSSLDLGAHLFVRTPDGTIWLIEGGARRPVSSMAALYAYGGGAPRYASVPAVAITGLPVGPVV